MTDAAIDDIAALLRLVPMVGSLDVQYVSMEPKRAVLRLPDHEQFRNHIGGPHAGAMFTLAESAAGALLFTNFADRLDKITPLVVAATITFNKIARGEVTATAVMDRAPSDLAAELDAGKRPEWIIEVELATADGVTGHMSATMTLRRNAP